MNQNIDISDKILETLNYCVYAYRFSFQGQEKDDEISGTTGGHLNYKYRVHDARIGRFLSIDPLTAEYPHNSPYAFSENRVIDGIELEGLEYIHYRVNSYNDHGQTCIELTGEVDYGNWMLNVYHSLTGEQPEVFPVHVVEAPDGKHYLFATKEEAYTSEMDDYNNSRWTLEGIGAMYNLSAVFGKVSGNTMKNTPKTPNGTKNSSSKTIGNEKIESVSSVAGKVEEVSKDISTNEVNSKNRKEETQQDSGKDIKKNSDKKQNNNE